MPQQTAQSPLGNGRALLVSIPVVIILLPLVCYIARGVISFGQASEPLLDRAASKTNCMEGIDGQGMSAQYMRYQHWEYLIELREDVVRHGDRTRGGLDSCRECHPSREAFCDRCHNATSLTPDCFQCHYYP